VISLANKVNNGDLANAGYDHLDRSGNVVTISLGSLHADASATQLAELVNKRFLGINEPLSITGHTYQAVSTSVLLTVNGFHYSDVTQGQVADCWLMARRWALPGPMDPCRLASLAV
jgi:hypothetical protein